MTAGQVVGGAFTIAFVIYFITVSIPHIAREDGLVSLFLFGAMIGAGVCYAWFDYQRKNERAEQLRKEIEARRELN